MRNTRFFDLNIFDEKVQIPDEDLPSSNPYFIKSMTSEQKELFESPFLKGLSLAAQKWTSLCGKYNEELINLFKERGEKEFSVNDGIFNQGKYWQMLDYLDGNYLLRIKNSDETRECYQNSLMSEECFGTGYDLLQGGWDLAINSALLCDLMPCQKDTGSIYLLENIVWDKNSLFYPSVTNEFQKRVVNEGFWQSLSDISQRSNINVLERILTQNFAELDVYSARDNILRCKGFPKVSLLEIGDCANLVSGTYGVESFQGLSPRAIENYGKFINQIFSRFDFVKETLFPFVKLYVDAVNCMGEEGIEYFQEQERKKLLELGCVRENNLMNLCGCD